MSAVLAHDLASPQACAARQARIAAANEAHTIRRNSLAAAYAVIRKHQVRGPWELLQVMQLIASSTEGDSITAEFKDRLVELCADLETELSPIQPEVTSFKTVAEFDRFTVGVSNRG